MIREFAPAKLNLYLHVAGRRTDGYHLLDSLVAFADVGDELAVSQSEGGTVIESIGPFAEGLPAAEDNLIYQAVHRLAAAVGRPPDVAIQLTKTLPIASGIGGGSADAAAALRGTGRLWGLDAGDQRLAAIAAGLGADVPMCLFSRPAFVSGIGEALREAPVLPPLNIALVNPGVPVSTPDVFRAFHQSGHKASGTAAPMTIDAGNARGFAAGLSERGNDLERAAAGLAPQMDDVLTYLVQSDGCLLARMSGSGATCYALYAACDEARHAADGVREAHPDWWSAAATLMPGGMREGGL